MQSEHFKRLQRIGLTVVLLAAAFVCLPAPAEQGLKGVAPGAASPEAAGANQQDQHDIRHVPSRPETVTWGWFPIDKPPVLTIQSGQTVRIDTLSLASIAVNFHVAEAVDLTQLVSGKIPKSLFLKE